MHGTSHFSADEAQVPPESRSKKTAAHSCTCDLSSPSFRELRSVEFNRDLAGRITALNVSGDATVDLVLSEVLDHRRGKLIGPDGIELPLDSSEAADVDWFDSLFSNDPRRFINRYKARALGNGGKNRLQEHLCFTVALIFLALEIRLPHGRRVFAKSA